MDFNELREKRLCMEADGVRSLRSGAKRIYAEAERKSFPVFSSTASARRKSVFWD